MWQDDGVADEGWRGMAWRVRCWLGVGVPQPGMRPPLSRDAPAGAPALAPTGHTGPEPRGFADTEAD